VGHPTRSAAVVGPPTTTRWARHTRVTGALPSRAPVAGPSLPRHRARIDFLLLSIYSSCAAGGRAALWNYRSACVRVWADTTSWYALYAAELPPAFVWCARLAFSKVRYPPSSSPLVLLRAQFESLQVESLFGLWIFEPIWCDTINESCALERQLDMPHRTRKKINDGERKIKAD